MHGRKNIKLQELYVSTPNIPITKSRRIRWAGHVACMRDRTVFWCGDVTERDQVEELGVDG